MKKNFFLSKKSKDREFRQLLPLPFGIAVSLLIMVLLSLAEACNRSPRVNQPLGKSYLLSHLNTKEKLELLGGVVMSTKPIPRLGIPSLHMDDGPLGVRWGPCYLFPFRNSHGFHMGYSSCEKNRSGYRKRSMG